MHNESKTQANRQETTNTTDNRVGAEGGSIAAGSGASIYFADADVAMQGLEAAAYLGGGAFDLAEAIGETALKAGTSISETSLTAALRIVEDSNEVTERTRVANNNMASGISETALAVAKAATQDPNAQISEQLADIAQYVVLGLGAAAVGFAIITKAK